MNEEANVNGFRKCIKNLVKFIIINNHIFKKSGSKYLKLKCLSFKQAKIFIVKNNNTKKMYVK